MLEQRGDETIAESDAIGKMDSQGTVEIPQVQCVDEINDVPVVARRREEGWLDEVSDRDLRWREGERLMSGKDPRSRRGSGSW